MNKLAVKEKAGKVTSKARTIYWSVVAGVMATAMSCNVLFASDFFSKISEACKNIYNELFGITTIIAVLMATIALIIRLVSKNQRAVDEATSWLKRIVITWIIINSLGLIVSFLNELVAGNNYTP